MKRVVLSTICAIVMIVTVCAIVLPASADGTVLVVNDRWDNGYNITTDMINSHVNLDWIHPEASPIEGNSGHIVFSGSTADALVFAIEAGSLSRTLTTNNFSVEFKYNVLPEQFVIYSNGVMIARWSYADPLVLYLYQEGDEYPQETIVIDEINQITFLYNWADVNTVSNDGYHAFLNMFGDYDLVDYDTLNIGRQEGYESGFSNGYYEGQQVGYNEGYNVGVSAGAGVDLEALAQESYDRGYSRAESDLLDSQTWGGNFLGNILNAPWVGLMQFELVQTTNGTVITLGEILACCIGVSFFVMFLKWFAGG